jgi:hypothetical protein
VAIGYLDETGGEGALMLHGLARADAAAAAVRRLILSSGREGDRSPDRSQDST